MIALPTDLLHRSGVAQGHSGPRFSYCSEPCGCCIKPRCECRPALHFNESNGVIQCHRCGQAA